jgi:hypothetical protein
MRFSALVAAVFVWGTACANSDAIARVQRCEGLVVSQQAAARDPNRPRFLDLTSPRGERLVYTGVRHTFDSADPQWAMMKSVWDTLQPTIVFYEGTGKFVGDSERAAIEKSGEPGLALFLASKAAVPAKSLEPSREEEVNALLRRFPAEQLVMFFALRPVMEERTRRNIFGAELERVLDGSLAQIHKIPRLAGVLPDTEALRAAFAREFPGVDPMALSADWFDPRRTSVETGSRFFNDVNQASSMFRDVYMYRLIAQAAQTPGARIFAEVGRDHIPAQAAALQCAMFP